MRFPLVGIAVSLLALPALAKDYPVADQHAGKVVFATSLEPFKKDDPTGFAKAFKYSDTVYWAAYNRKLPKDELAAQGVKCSPYDNNRGLAYLASIDGKNVGDAETGLGTGSDQEWGDGRQLWFQYPLYGKPSSLGYKGEFDKEAVPTLTVGSHTVKLTLHAWCMDAEDKTKRHWLATPVAEGEFTLEVAAADMDGINKKLAVKKEAEAKLAAANKPVPLPKAAQSNPKLEAEMLAAMKAKWPTDQIKKVVIVDKAWDVQTAFKEKIPQSRTIRTAVAVRQGEACKYFEVTFIQTTKNGGKSWSPTDYHSVGDNKPMACP